MGTLFTVDKNSKIKLYYQLYTTISQSIREGQLKPHEQIPSIRTISTDLNISRNTVTKAYELLENDGFIHSSAKSGFYVREKRYWDNPSVPKAQPGQSVHGDSKDTILTVDSVVQQRLGNIFKNNPFEDQQELNAAKETSGTTLSSDGATATSGQEQNLQSCILSSYNSVLSSATDIFTADTPAFGLQQLKKVISTLMASKRSLNLTSDRIIVGSTEQELLSMIVNLKSLFHLPEQPAAAAAPKKEGLLQRAQHSQNTEDTSHNAQLTFLVPQERSDSYNYALNLLPAEISLEEYDNTNPQTELTQKQNCSGWILETDRMIPENNSLTIPYENFLSTADAKSVAQDRVIYICRSVNCAWMVLPKPLHNELRVLYGNRIGTLSMLDQMVLSHVLEAFN